MSTPSIKEFEYYTLCKNLLTKYLKLQNFDTYATDLYNEIKFKDRKIIISEPISFKVGAYNHLTELNIHVGVGANENGYTLYLINNDDIIIGNPNLFFYSNPDLLQYIDLIEKNEGMDLEFLRKFDIHNVIYHYSKNYNKNSYLDNLIERYLNNGNR